MLLKTSTILCDHKFNSRGHVFPHEVTGLAELIEKAGLVNPVSVRSAADAGIDTHEWQLIAGYRRFTAVTAVLRKDVIEATIVENCTDKDAKRINLIENLGRKDLHPGQELEAIIAVYGEEPDPSVVAKDIGMSKLWVERRLAIRRLADPVKTLMFDGSLSAFDLSLLITCPLADQEALAKELINAKSNGRSTSSIAAGRGKLRRPRCKGDIHAMITKLIEEGREPSPWRALAWAAGSLTDEELLEDSWPKTQDDNS